MAAEESDVGGKTVVQLLQEWGDKTGSAPVYDWQWGATQGDMTRPSFTCRVTVGGKTYTGEGASKKVTKLRAAEAAWAAVQQLAPADATAESKPPKKPAAPPLPNTVGELQCLAMRKGLDLPLYVVVEERGPAHQKEFTMSCEMGRFKTTATGPSKKQAKQAVAQKVLEQVMATLESDDPCLQPEEEHGQSSEYRPPPLMERPLRPLVELPLPPPVDPPWRSSVERPLRPPVDPPWRPSVDPPWRPSVDPPWRPSVDRRWEAEVPIDPKRRRQSRFDD